MRDMRGRIASVFLLAVALLVSQRASAQAGNERAFRQSKSAVERALKGLEPSMSGRLPALEGFALAGDRPLNRYERAYFQSAVQVSSTASGGSLVKVTTKVTAWYADAIPSHSGYQLLTSNGRLESDLLDELAERLATTPGAVTPSGGSDNGFPATSSEPPSSKPP